MVLAEPNLAIPIRYGLVKKSQTTDRYNKFEGGF